VRAGPADLPGQFLVGGTEIIQQLLVGSRLFQRVELFPVQVLHQRVAQQVVVGSRAHDGRDIGQPGPLCGPPSPFPHDQLVLPAAGFADDDRLEQPDFPDGLDQLIESVLIEHLPWLAGVRRHGGDRQFLEVRAAHGAASLRGQPGRTSEPGAVWALPRAGHGGRAGRDKRTQPLAEPALLLSHRLSSLLRFLPDRGSLAPCGPSPI
jgi:hypothetical protein